MLTITIQVDRPPGQAIGAKEQVAMALEHIGDGDQTGAIEDWRISGGTTD